jgi:aryl-alcohol dehydrogenase-like predicted oxidoreductase
MRQVAEEHKAGPAEVAINWLLREKEPNRKQYSCYTTVFERG